VADQHASSFTTPLLPQSTTYYTSIVSASGCEGARKPVVAEIIQFEDATINLSETGDSLRSNYAEGNQWYFNQTILPGATGQSLKPDHSGVYRVEVAINGCATSADFEFVITGMEDPNSRIISVSPNPVVKELTVNVPGVFESIGAFRVINSFGQTVGRIELRPVNGMKRGHLDMTNYAAGLYILQAVGAEDVVEVKVIKQ
jgi:hypothetical protein